MWSIVGKQFERQRLRINIAKKMIECGIRVGEDDRLYVGDVEIDYTALARSTRVDRRVVRQTVMQIRGDEYLRSIFSKLSPSGASLVSVVSRLGYSALVIEADPRRAGVIAAVASVLAENEIVIRQCLADDPDMVPEARLTVVVEGNLTGKVLQKLESLPAVTSLTVKK